MEAPTRQQVADDPSLLTFSLLALASVCWVVLVVLLLPRLLGRGLAFLANRASRGAFHVVVPTLHIYPLAGRAVAHSLRYTVPDGTITAEELVLQIRWWRKAPESQFRQLLAVDDAHTLDPVAHAEQELARQNSAFLPKRLFYRLRRWWRRSAGPTDANASEPPPLISLIAVGLRARLVNMQANYEHVNRVLALAKTARNGRLDVPVNELAELTQTSTAPNRHDSSASSYESEQSTDAKPLRQRIAELVSLRITSGSFYFCDMGESPLIRIVVDSAKIRYRYGAAACPIDECRKRFRVRLSGLRVSVADRETVRKLAEPVLGPTPPLAPDVLQDNTDRMIRRVMALGHKGISDPFRERNRTSQRSLSSKRPRKFTSGSDAKSPTRSSLNERRPSFRYQNRATAWEARRSQPLPCANILSSETAVVDYVFDEPGPAAGRDVAGQDAVGRTRSGPADISSETYAEDTSSYPPPVCRVSVLLRGASFSYDTKAIADIERVMERLQPAFYDLMPLAMKAQSQDGKRSATGIQIEVDATPVVPLSSRKSDTAADAPLISIPFKPREMSWSSLRSLDVRRWPRRSGKDPPPDKRPVEFGLPPSSVDIHARHVSVRTEVPYRIGAEQRTNVSLRAVSAVVRGVLDMPLVEASSAEVNRALQLPQVWNGVHSSIVDIILRDSQTVYLPDMQRVIDDMIADIQGCMKKPQDVRYFVPFKETTRVLAENGYSVIFSCSHDNAWDDVHTLKADKYGKMRICGENAELVLTPSVPTEFLPDFTVVSWTLSLPNATGKIELPFPHKPAASPAEPHGEGAGRPSDSYRSLHHKGRAPSLARRVRSQLETLASHLHHSDTKSAKPRERTHVAEIVQAGKVLSISGKVVLNEGRTFLNSSLPSLPDAVDRSDINIRASSLALDINPHHITHFLNLSRNYAGAGAHMLTAVERDRLHSKRRDVAHVVLNERRYPFLKECVVLGLPAGQTLLMIEHRKAMDELISVGFQTESLVARFHDLPHALSPFNKRSKNLSSLESGRFVCSVRGSRLGLDVVCSPESRDKRVTLHYDYREPVEQRGESEGGSRSDDSTAPTISIEQFQVRKRSLATADWGPYKSQLLIGIGSLTGCIHDSDVLCASRVGIAGVPDPLFEDQAAAAALLSVENIEVVVGKVDLLVLSASSNASAERSGQVSKLSMLRHERSRRRSTKQSSAPTFLTGVAHFRAPLGLRFFLSNLSSETVAAHSRLTLPDVSMALLMSWGGKLAPWIDEATLRAQVAHAMLVRDGNLHGSFQGGGLMRTAAAVRDVTLEIVHESRPRMWAQTVAELQRHHVSGQSQKVRGETPVWCLETGLEAEDAGPLEEDEIDLDWWIYLRQSHRASILTKHVREHDSRLGKLETFSINIVSNVKVIVSPETLEVANDIAIRYKEGIWGQESAIFSQSKRDSNQAAPEVSLTDITDLWHLYEVTRPPAWSVVEDARSGVLLRGFEAKAFTVVFLSPLLPGEVHSGDPLFSSGAEQDEEFFLTVPFGFNILDASKTEVSDASTGNEGIEQQGLVSRVDHTRVIHSSVPKVMVGCNNDGLLEISGIVVILREQSKIGETSESEEVARETVREDKQAIVAKVASLSLGGPNSSLQQYACVGRIASIFTLMLRALSLENASLAAMKNGQIEDLVHGMLPLSMAELTSMEAGYVRTFLSETSQQILDRESEIAGKGKGVAILRDMPQFVVEEATGSSGNVKYGIIFSLDVTVRKTSLRLAGEDIIRADIMACKGGSTARAQTESALEGHVFNATFGVISLSIRDDIAANTLRMVSEVASFIRQATISMPMLRYDAQRASGEKESSELFSYSYMNEEFLKASIRTSLEQASLAHEHKRRIHFPLRSHQSSRKSRGHWYSRSKSRARTASGGQDSFSVRQLGASSQRTSHRGAEAMTGNASDTFHAAKSPKSDPLVRSSAGDDSEEGNTFPKRNGNAHVSFAGIIRDKRTERPKSVDAGQSVLGSKGRYNRGDVFEEDNQYFAYVAVPTAGETGPPRKRSKARVLVSTQAPPAFSDVDLLSRSEKSRTAEMLSAGSQYNPVSPTHRREASAPLQRRSATNVQSNTSNEPFSQRVPRSSDQGTPVRPKLLRPKKRPALTLFVSFREIVSRYYRRKSLPDSISASYEKEADISLFLGEPRVTFMSEPSKGSHSMVVTASSSRLKSGNNPNCVLKGSIGSVGATMSVVEGFVPTTLPKLIASARISEFKTTLHATDLKSVLNFREEFKSDLKAVVSAFLTTKSSISEMARATRLSAARILYAGRTLYSTMAFDLLCEDSRIRLEGFHPKDSAMSLSYLLDGLFFSVVASEDDSAALTLGLRLYGHGLSLSSPSWSEEETFHFPSFDARGVQWGETTGLPTLLKVNAEPLINSTSVQGLRHVIFTVAGLMAFQNTATTPTMDVNDAFLPVTPRQKSADIKEVYSEGQIQSQSAGATPFTRSFAAWERTKGVRMDVSIRPMSVSLASGQVVARFDMEAITGIFEWNKLVRSGVQLRAAVSVPRISLMFLRMLNSDFTTAGIRNIERRASMSIALERSRLDVLKTQEELTHTFIFRVDVYGVSGQLRPWRMLLDAAVWADEQEFVSDLQAINTAALASSRPRTPKSPKMADQTKPLEHRVILVGAKVQLFKLAVPLLNTEEYSSSRLALRVTQLHFLVRQRFDSENERPRRNIFEVKSDFIGILWENTAMLSSHNSRITLGIEPPSILSNAHFGSVQLIMLAGTWRICPRKDVVMAILEAKNGRENKKAAEKSRDILGSLPDVLSKAGSITGDSFSNTTERHGRLLFESLRLKILRTSGFIEGLEGDEPARNIVASPSNSLGRPRSSETSKLAVPAFSVAVVRDERETFDLIDVDFSGREGEFPRQCLQRVANVFTDLFGAVASDQEDAIQDIMINPANEPREISRDTSVLIRFGKSLYKAQEEGNTSVESKFSFFAGRTSSILVSVTTAPLFGDEIGHTTVVTGVSPKLALEITPLIEGAREQSLRLIDARVLHGISPVRPPHTLLNITRVTALMDAKTLLLTQGRIQAARKKSGPCPGSAVEPKSHSALPKAASERNVMIAFGRPKLVVKEEGVDNQPTQDSFIEPNIRLQLKLPSKKESPSNQVDIFAERLHLGIGHVRRDPYAHAIPSSVHVSLHDLNLRGQWDIVSCKLRLRENLFNCAMSGVRTEHGGSIVVTNIMNRLQFESRQHDNHTMKLGIDALAAVVSVPSRTIVVESTIVKSEFSHTMMKSILRLTGQAKKLMGEVKLLIEKEVSKGAKRKTQPRLYSFDGRSGDSLVAKEDASKSRDDMNHLHVTTVGDNSSSSHSDVADPAQKLKRSGKRTKVSIRGDGLSAVLRGYQFEETQHSAMVSVTRYDVNYQYSCILSRNAVHIKELGIDFENLRMSYNDDERAIHSDLFRVPSPKLKLKVVDTDKELTVELLGDLELKLGPGFYLFRDFMMLSELTIKGIRPAHEPTEVFKVSPAPDRPEVWDGRVAQVSVRLNPRIDVIGDLTQDMLQFMNSKKDHVTILPKHLYDNVVVHLEELSEACCDPLCR